MVRQEPLGHIRHQNGVADIRVAFFDFCHGQVVGQMTGADDFDAIIKNEDGMAALTR